LDQHIFSLSAFLVGIPVGFVFSFALGPVFFSLITASLEHGLKAAVYIALGVVLADLALLTIAYSGVEAFLPKGMDVAFWVQLVGGIFLLSIGLGTILKRNAAKTATAVPIEKTTLALKNLSKGFFLNILNPANFFEWVGAAGVLKTRYNFEAYENVSFFSGAILAVFITEFSVAYFARRLRNVIDRGAVRKINLATGSLLLIFGLWMLFEAFR
jgi:threonine/homoserine/homoserine lactone efflux protein